MKNNLKFILIILLALFVPTLILFTGLLAAYYGHAGPLQFLFSGDASATWDPLVNFTGDISRPLWPENTILFFWFIPTAWQAVISIILLAIAVVLTWMNPKNQKVRVAAMILATITIIRHLCWRGALTLDFASVPNAIVGVIVYGAEISAFIAMLLGYFQMFKLVETPKIPIENIPEEKLPTVDVFLTTYNEGTDILYRGIVGCLSLDYPKKKVYLLDDGNRPEVKELCNHLGCGYITRPSNEHAKAGNLNNALQYTDGELVVIFDADYIPTTVFLKETVGQFINDKKLAYVQTPQHFFTPDPFQRNLLVEKTVTNEQDLFYQVIQPGNNYWGSAFFAGSAAIFRRAPLSEIGGFAIETITEDTHTGIRLHAKKYKSLYVNKIMSAGLAQDSFMDYLNQRLRWGRGMFQILRYDNPLFVPGLRFPQRLCYFSGIYYFFHGLPRIVFLAAPLCFLAGGLKPIDAGIYEMIIYYAPSFLISIMAFSIASNGIRQTFWSEVYESATALFLFLTTTMAIISPKRARFKVTPKGTISSETRFDWFTVIPQLLLASLTILGLSLGLLRMVVTPEYIGGILPNVFWGSYNMILMLGAIIVASNRPQYRSSPRIFRKVRCELSLVDNTYAVGYTTNISETGLALELEKPIPVSDIVTVRITDTDINLNTTITGQVIRSVIGKNDHHYIGVRLINRTDQQHQNLTRHMFTAPGIWEKDTIYEKKSTGSFMKLMTTLFRWGSTEEVPFYRVAPRFDKNLPCVVMYKDETIIGMTSEISETGAAVRVKSISSINLNDVVTLRIQWPDSKISEIHSEVVRTIKSDNESYLIGVKFKTLSIEQKLNIIIHLYEASGDVVRVAPIFRRTLSCIINKSGLPEPIPGFTYEVSETDISIGVKYAPLQKGDQVTIGLQWEDGLRQEFNAKVINIYEDSDNDLVKLYFYDITPQLRKDLIKRLYTAIEEDKIYAPQM